MPLNEFPRVVRGNEKLGISSDFSKNKREEESGILRRRAGTSGGEKNPLGCFA